LQQASTGVDALQLPDEQVSPVVQTLLSSQAAVFAGFWQPTPAAQLSSVHTLLSSQESWDPEKQLPPRHTSSTVQGSPSSQGSEFGIPPVQDPTLQASPDVQPLLSSQEFPVLGVF